MENNEIYHHGILGQRWGVRRYQNEDGTLTKAGINRYAKSGYESDAEKLKNSNNSATKNGKILFKSASSDERKQRAEKYLKECGLDNSQAAKIAAKEHKKKIVGTTAIAGLAAVGTVAAGKAWCNFVETNLWSI